MSIPLAPISGTVDNQAPFDWGSFRRFQWGGVPK